MDAREHVSVGEKLYFTTWATPTNYNHTATVLKVTKCFVTYETTRGTKRGKVHESSGEIYIGNPPSQSSFWVAGGVK